MQLKRAAGGFTLTELAVVMVIVAFLIAGGIMTLNSQLEQRSYEETVRRLNAAAEAVLAFAVVNRRLPCPAAPASTGVESPAGGACTNSFNGFLPAESIGFGHIDAERYGLDAYGNRIRYAVATAIAGCMPGTPPALPATPHFTSAANLKANGISCRPNDLDICTSAACAARVVSAGTAAFIVFSTGKNGALLTQYGTDETENTDGDAVFVSHVPGTTGAAAFDDIMVVVPVGVLYAKLISAGALP